MAKQLQQNVLVGDTYYGPDYPGNEVTSEVRDQITNPAAWGEDVPDPLDAENGGLVEETVEAPEVLPQKLIGEHDDAPAAETAAGVRQEDLLALAGLTPVDGSTTPEIEPAPPVGDGPPVVEPEAPAKKAPAKKAAAKRTAAAKG